MVLVSLSAVTVGLGEHEYLTAKRSRCSSSVCMRCLRRTTSACAGIESPHELLSGAERLKADAPPLPNGANRRFLHLFNLDHTGETSRKMLEPSRAPKSLPDADCDSEREYTNTRRYVATQEQPQYHTASSRKGVGHIYRARKPKHSSRMNSEGKRPGSRRSPEASPARRGALTRGSKMSSSPPSGRSAGIQGSVALRDINTSGAAGATILPFTAGEGDKRALTKGKRGERVRGLARLHSPQADSPVYRYSTSR
ncbi:hypothetical protein EYF80_039137 [Liparis tanakae]|uniref:Uncharacterized protein n=1 Tax=Liparis tanakae TaxID=230148 RepID=A0A4Z2GAQ9_9TELE|nr:hypothetical protein EYF80_039137 [Liparis tanakae]